MRNRIVRAGGIAVFAGLLLAGLTAAGEDKPAQRKLSPEEQKMMDVWMKLATPNENHKALEPMVGTFDAKVTSWAGPGQPPEVTTGVSTNTWVLGGRFVQQVMDGTEMGQPFHGIGFTGYDNYKKAYTAVWMDNMGTMTLWMTGSAEDGGKTFKFAGTMDDAMSGKPAHLRSVTRVIDNNHHVFEMYGPDPSGHEVKMLEIAYTRR